ncbi:MAG: enoyl-CoA hydratase/isomerase family protein [Dethiobacteria bacterium]|jgi:enoyl-CoA hydratase|nr:enoyl-CoA hydratase/isomerase family protein [Bacillota bacterium]
MKYETIILTKEGKIATLTFNRPESRNAFNVKMLQELDLALEETKEDDDVHVLVITGAGKSFSAGFDIKESILNPKTTVAARRLDTEQEKQRWLRVWNYPKPIIVAVNGHCLGGALEMMLLCDLAISSDRAVFGEPEIIFSYMVQIPILPWAVGMRKARELLYTGESIDAYEAQRLGIVNKVVEHDQLMEATYGLAQKLADMPVEPLQLTKYSVNRTYELQGILDTFNYGCEIFNLCRLSNTDDSEEFAKIVREKGLKAAMQWASAKKDN